MAQLLRDIGEEQPARMVLFSPWLDLGVSDPLAATVDPTDPVLGIDGLRQAGRWYAAGTALDDPEISPVHADLTGLGPTAVLIGTRDVLLPDARRLHKDAERSGTEVDVHEYPGMFHNWIMQPLPEAVQAREQLPGSWPVAEFPAPPSPPGSVLSARLALSMSSPDEEERS